MVKLRAETAQFQADLGKVKSDLAALKGQSGETSDGVSTGFKTMSTHSGGLRTQIGLLDNAIRGAHAQAMADLIRKFSDTKIVMELLPIAATGAAFIVMGGIAIEAVKKIVEAFEAAKSSSHDWGNATTTAATKSSRSLEDLGDKLLEAGIKADDLAGNHVAALSKQLELLDHASLKELMESLDTFGAEADKVFTVISAGTHFWTVFTSGATGAKNALGDFKTQYDSLLAQGDSGGAKSLLQGTLQSALKLQEVQRDYNRLVSTGDAEHRRNYKQITQEQLADLAQLHAAGIGADKAGLAIQQQVVSTLQDQIKAAVLIASIKAQDSANAKTSDSKADGSAAKTKAAAAARLLAEANRQEAALEKAAASGVEQHSIALIRLARTKAEAAIAGNTDGAGAQKAMIAEERDSEIAAANASLAAKKVAYDADIKAASLTARGKQTLTQEWKNDQQRTADAIIQFNADAAAKMVAADRTAAKERASVEEEYAQTVAKDKLSIAEFGAMISRKAAEEEAKNSQAMHNATAAQALKSAQAAVQAETNAEVAGYNARLKALDKFDKNYLKNVEQLQADITKATMKGAAEQQGLAAAAAQKETMTVKQAQDRMADALAGDIAKSIMGQRSLAASFRQTGEQMAEQMIKNLLIAEITQDKTKLIQAEGAATKSFNWASGWGGPIAGGIAAAAAFAGVMSFETGGKIPGSGVGSAGAVPIIGHQGETVVTKALTDRVESSERRGGSGGGPTNIHFSPTIHAVDATGVDAMLAKHASIFQRHIGAALRRMNR